MVDQGEAEQNRKPLSLGRVTTLQIRCQQFLMVSHEHNQNESRHRRLAATTPRPDLITLIDDGLSQNKRG